MIAHNDITGDLLRTKGANNAYRDGWDRIFGKKEEPAPAPTPEPAKVEAKAADVAQLEADALRQEWWKYCADNQSTLSIQLSTGNLVPTFEEWRALVGR